MSHKTGCFIYAIGQSHDLENIRLNYKSVDPKWQHPVSRTFNQQTELACLAMPRAALERASHRALLNKTPGRLSDTGAVSTAFGFFEAGACFRWLLFLLLLLNINWKKSGVPFCNR